MLLVPYANFDGFRIKEQNMTVIVFNSGRIYFVSFGKYINKRGTYKENVKVSKSKN